jgi:predicted transcriptional regulator of viral defense system
MITARETRKLGVHPECLRRLRSAGLLVRIGRGIYALPGAAVTANHSLAVAAVAVPRGVVCLLSALRYHGVGTQSPRQVWLALDRRAARPRAGRQAIRTVRFSGGALAEGITTRVIEGIAVRIYSPAKTVADCFKYRNKIGLDVALEALREALAGRKCTMDELWRYARVCRVAEIMRPYMEAIA